MLDAAGIPIHCTDPIARRASTSPAADLGEGYLLATVGGGADGFELLAALIDAARVRSDGLEMVLVTGPLMPAASVAELRERSTGLPVRLFESRPDLDDLMAGARVIVAMAGYNTAGEVLASGKPALLVPRTFPQRGAVQPSAAGSRRRDG